MTLTLTIARRADRYYPEANGQPFVYRVPGSSINSVVSFGNMENAKAFLYSDPDKRTITYMDAGDAAEPFKTVLAFPYVAPPEPPMDPADAVQCEACQ